jgi:hypothetical protein
LAENERLRAAVNQSIGQIRPFWSSSLKGCFAAILRVIVVLKRVVGIDLKGGLAYYLRC